MTRDLSVAGELDRLFALTDVHPDPVIAEEVAADAVIAARFNYAHGIDQCPLCELGWPRPPSSVSNAVVHIVGLERVVCPVRS